MTKLKASISETDLTSSNPPSTKRILIVDDDPMVRGSLNEVLVSEGYTVSQAENGQQALNLAAGSNQVDLVLLDLNMPLKNGWDTFERLSSQRPLLPVILITARPNQLFTACNAGVGALLEKPLDIPILLKTVKTLLQEPVETRLARIVGHSAPIHFLPLGGPYRVIKD